MIAAAIYGSTVWTVVAAAVWLASMAGYILKYHESLHPDQKPEQANKTKEIDLSKTFELYMGHGRKTPDQQLSVGDLAAVASTEMDGPRLQGVISCSQMIGEPVTIEFADRTTMLEAKRLTGWDQYDDRSLIMRCHGNFVHCVCDGVATMYYGAWGLAHRLSETFALSTGFTGKTPEEAGFDWRTSGPGLQGVISCYQMIGEPVTIDFADRAAMLEAKRLTGWDECESGNSLTMRWHGNVVHCVCDGVATYCAYWSVNNALAHLTRSRQ
jgi:hypothetical protein